MLYIMSTMQCLFYALQIERMWFIHALIIRLAKLVNEWEKWASVRVLMGINQNQNDGHENSITLVCTRIDTRNCVPSTVKQDSTSINYCTHASTHSSSWANPIGCMQ